MLETGTPDSGEPTSGNPLPGHPERHGLRTPSLTGTERAELGAEPEDFLVLAVGNIRPAKDYGTLLKAAALVQSRGLPLRLVVLGQGNGPLMEELEREQQALGLTGVVSFAGFHSEVPRLLASADAFVTSSSSEGFSLSTVEALWLGRPVVATRSGGPEEIIRDGETGHLVPISNPGALADALIEVYRNPSRAKKWAEAGRQDVRRRFGQSAMLAAYESLYRKMLQ